MTSDVWLYGLFGFVFGWALVSGLLLDALEFLLRVVFCSWFYVADRWRRFKWHGGRSVQLQLQLLGVCGLGAFVRPWALHVMVGPFGLVVRLAP